MGVEGQSTLHRELAHRHEGSGIPHLHGEVAERAELGRVGQAIRRVDVERQSQILQRSRLQHPQRPRGQAVVEGGRGCGFEIGDDAERQARLPELRPRELPVIGDGLKRGALVEGLGQPGFACRLGGAALPIGHAGQRDRRLGDGRGLGEMVGGLGRIVEEAQGDPAGMELGLDPLLHGAAAMAGGDLVGEARIADIDELAGDDPALDPPFVAIHQDIAVGGGGGEDSCGFHRLVGSAQVLRPRQDVGRIAAERRRHGVQRGGGRRTLVFHGTAGADQTGVAAAGIGGGPPGRLVILLQERALHAEAVIDAGEDIRKGIHHLGLEGAPECFRAPQVADQGGGVLVEGIGPEGEGEGELAWSARRTCSGEEGAHGRRVLALGEKCLLGAAAEERTRRPFRVRPGEGDSALEADAGAGADRHPFEQRESRRIGEAVAQAVAFGDLAAPIGVDGLAQSGEVDIRRDLRGAGGVGHFRYGRGRRHGRVGKREGDRRFRIGGGISLGGGRQGLARHGLGAAVIQLQRIGGDRLGLRGLAVRHHDGGSDGVARRAGGDILPLCRGRRENRVRHDQHRRPRQGKGEGNGEGGTMRACPERHGSSGPVRCGHA